jgi:hypothetical protein
LSNAEIQKIVQKLQDFKYVILTEHLPQGDFIANIDIISGQGIRMKKKSGIDLLKAPFYFKVNDCKDLVTMYLEGQKGVLVTTLYTM